MSHSRPKPIWMKCPKCGEPGRQEILTRPSKSGGRNVMRYVHYRKGKTATGQRRRSCCQIGVVVTEQEFAEKIGVPTHATDVL